MIDNSIAAWNNFVMKSGPEDHPAGSEKRAAAVVAQFWGAANNGGFYSALECTPQFAADEILLALSTMGATSAADQLRAVLAGIGTSLPAMSSEERCSTLLENWPESLDDSDVLSGESDKQIQYVLERHVTRHEADYLAL